MTDTALRGQTILVASSEDNAGALADAIVAAGGRAATIPTVRIVPPSDLGPLDHALRLWASYDWVVFTSRHGVEAVAARAKKIGVNLSDASGRIAAVGPATKAATEAKGMTVSAMPAEYRTEAIAETLGEVRGKRILLPRSRIARKALAETLRRRGADVTEVDAYDAVRVVPDMGAMRALGPIDFVVFTSGSTVDYFVEGLSPVLLDDVRRHAQAACIGPVTAEAAEEKGFRVTVIASEHTIPGLVRALVEEVRHG